MFGVEESRKYRRMNVGCEIMYKKSEPSESRAAFAKNLSSTGILFVADEKFNPDEVAEIEIAPGTNSISNFKATVRVIRCTPTKNFRQYEVAAEITNKI